MNVTKKREGERWRVYVDGKKSPFAIERSFPAKYGHVQKWDVFMPEDDTFLFDAKGLSQALDIISVILNVKDAQP